MKIRNVKDAFKALETHLEVETLQQQVDKAIAVATESGYEDYCIDAETWLDGTVNAGEFFAKKFDIELEYPTSYQNPQHTDEVMDIVGFMHSAVELFDEKYNLCGEEWDLVLISLSGETSLGIRRKEE